MLTTTLKGAAVKTKVEAEVAVMPGSWSGIDQLDQQLFIQLGEIARTFEVDAKRIWDTTFRPDQMPLLLARNAHSDDAYAYAVNFASPVAIDGSLDGPVVQVAVPAWLDLGPVYKVAATCVNRVGLSPTEPAMFAYELAGQECLALSVDSSEALASSWEFSRFLVHEAFHQYQMFEMGWRVPQGYDPATPWILDPVDAELATREMWYLEAAVMQLSDNGANELARRFLDVRAKRHARRTDLIPLERGHEQVEGSARYVENMYASLNGRPFRLPLPTVSGAAYKEFVSIGRYYRTGARAMELLDRAGISWRDRMAEGLDPVQLLDEHLSERAETVAVRAPELDLVSSLAA